MNLYLLTRLDEIDYDECEGFVVRAESTKRARHLAAEQAGDETGLAWIDMESTDICEIASNVDGPETIILKAFNAG